MDNIVDDGKFNGVFFKKRDRDEWLKNEPGGRLNPAGSRRSRNRRIAFKCHCIPHRYQTSPFYLEVSMRSSEPGTAQVYYDIGRGIKAADSTTARLRDGNS